MKKPFIALFTETPNSGNSGSDAVTAALLVVFANRDAQTLDDVEGTKVNLESQGEGVHVREFDFLREIPDLWDLRPSPAGAGEGGRRPDEGRGENPILSTEAADRAEAIEAAAIRPSPAGAGEGGRRPDEGRGENPIISTETADRVEAAKTAAISPSPAGAGEGGRTPDEGRGENPIISTETADRAEAAKTAAISPSPAGAGEGGRRPDEGRGENPILSTETADRAKTAKTAAISPSPAGAGEGGRRPDEGRGENPILSTETADRVEAAKTAAISPSPAGAGRIIGPDAVSAIHRCLRLLAGHCDGARTLDGAGFNKMDAEFGHSLADAHALSPKQAVHGQKLIRKYHRQLPADLLQTALGTDEVPIIPEKPLSNLHSPVPDCGPDAVSVCTPAMLVNRKYRGKSGDEVARNCCEEYYGDTYQNGVQPGPKKLAQFREVLELTGTPKLYAQEAKGDEALVHVKLFDPTGSWTWFITEFDPAENTAFGLVNGHEAEVGYIDLNELANARGRMGIGIEIDMHFKPQPLAACRAALV